MWFAIHYLRVETTIINLFMKKKLKALVQGTGPLDNVELNRLKKALEAAKLKFEKAKIAKKEAKAAFIKAADHWLAQSEIPHTPSEKKAKKTSKSKKPNAASSAKSDKVSLK